MEIMKVLGRMVCTQRVAGLGHMNLRILENNKGKKLVAVDPVGVLEKVTGFLLLVALQLDLHALIQKFKLI